MKQRTKVGILFVTVILGQLFLECGNNNSGVKTNDSSFLLKQITLSEKNRNTLNQIKSLREVVVPVDTISLEYNKNSLIGQINKICRYPYGFVILDKFIAKKVYIFSNEGKFIAVLGKHGKGPREYQHPVDIDVDENGDCYVLDSSLRKLIVFDKEGSFKKYISFRHINFYPSGFELLSTQILGKNKILFYNLHPDFGKKVNNKKLILTEINNGKIRLLKSFGEQEPVLKKMFFDMGAFHCTDNGIVWLADVFDLDISIYNIKGELMKKPIEHKSLLPKPHISQIKMLNFSRPSESLDTFDKLTKLSTMTFLDSIIIAYYSNTKKNKFYCLLFDYSGRPILRSSLITKRLPFPSCIVGSSGNDFFVYKEPEVPEEFTEEVPNPSIIIFRLILDRKII